MERSAIISEDLRYRYRLERRWADAGARATWVMLNPSVANGERDDPTIRACIRFSQREGCGSLVVVNLFGMIATYPSVLLVATDPMGHNQAYLKQAVDEAELLIVAWGANGRNVPGVGVTARWLARSGAKCLGVTRDGHPRHPLYLRKDTPLRPFRWAA